MTAGRLRAGDRVVVRSPEEILATLDADGTLDGLPFMPEMLDLCGRSFRVQRRVEKTCADVPRHVAPTRRFRADDVVMLDGPRCDGGAHDGCKRGCRIFWKEAWLRPAEASAAQAATPAAGRDALRARLKVKADLEHYFCQSTELSRATEPFPGRQKVWAIRLAFREIRNGDRSAAEMVTLFARWCWQRLLRVASRDRLLRGPNRRTPTASLDLKPGERVRVKSRAQIVETLDHRRRNRGMGICYEVTRCCGSEAEVRYRVDRIIDEKTALMRELQDTVALHPMSHDGTLGEECLCYDELGDCPRGELMYWREIWLERAGGDAAKPRNG